MGGQNYCMHADKQCSCEEHRELQQRGWTGSQCPPGRFWFAKTKSVLDWMSRPRVVAPSSSQTGIGWVIREVKAVDQTPGLAGLLVQRQVRIDPMLIRSSTGRQVRASEFIFIFVRSRGVYPHTTTVLLDFGIDFQSQAWSENFHPVRRLQFQGRAWAWKSIREKEKLNIHQFDLGTQLRAKSRFSGFSRPKLASLRLRLSYVLPCF